jgi:hypothetical protein
MKKTGLLLLLLQVLVLPLLAQAPAACTMCVGMVGNEAPANGLYRYVRLQEADLTTFTPADPANLTIVVEYPIDPSGDKLLQVEQHTSTLLEWAKAHGAPFDGLGVSVTGADPALAAYAVKRLSVSAQGLDVARRIVLPRTEDLSALFENGAQPYFDALIAGASDVESSLAWLAERDPSKKVFAIVPVTSPNALFDLGKALAAGATRAYATGTADAAALAQFNRTMTGDWAYDSTARVPVLDAKGNAAEMPVLSFVRGEDLRTLLIARGDAGAPSILSLSSDRFTSPRRVDATGERAITDVGRRGSQLLVGSPAAKSPYAIVVDYAEKPDRNVTKETVNVATARGITVEEIIRNHQAYDAFQESIEPKYIAKNTTKLRFDIGGGAEGLEASIAGDYFSDPAGKSDWVWKDFFINGVKWKYGRIPELPLIQPEKVTQLPLDIHFSNDYRYELVRETEVAGYKTYEVRFEPPPNAPEGLPLYRGTVWIDAHTWARIRLSMIQLHLTGEVLSNEERVDFAPFSRESHAPLSAADVATADPRSILWLPYSVNAQQVISAAGRASVIERATSFENFRLDPSDFETLLASASASDARMVRETDAGLRYLEKTGSGERVVKEGYDTAQLFMLGGVHHDSGLEYPVVPLGGIDYFNFNLMNRGIQTNVFFAGLVLAANATHPNVGNTRTNVGADFFGIAVPTENKIYRDGEEQPAEAVKSLPVGLYLRAGHPFLNFGKVDVSLGISHQTYSRGDDTPLTFELPSSTFTLSPGIEVRYARRGYTFGASYDYNTRTTWEPWGDPAEFSDDQKNYTHFGASAGKSFFLPKFQRIGVDLNYVDGQHLDRFSKYELGFFGAHRVHGIQSGTVRAEQALIGHVSYGFVFSEQFRLETFYDHALIDDELAGYRREPFQGIGIAGQTIGPFGTLLRLDIGKSIGRNAQEGFVANIVFLKLF